MTIPRATVEAVETAIARTGSIEGACRQLPHLSARVVAAVWDEMQDAVYPTEVRGRPGSKPKEDQ